MGRERNGVKAGSSGGLQEGIDLWERKIEGGRAHTEPVSASSGHLEAAPRLCSPSWLRG